MQLIELVDDVLVAPTRWISWCRCFGDVDEVDVDDIDVDVKDVGDVDEVRSWIWHQFFGKKALHSLATYATSMKTDQIWPSTGKILEDTPDFEMSLRWRVLRE